MKAPESLETLIDYGIVQEVVRPLMSGKEAQVYVVRSGGEVCVAKVYKEATQRTFKHRSDYTEGRKTRNTRDQRAMSKRTAHGRKKDEDAWRSTEVDVIHRLKDAGVRVPEPINFVEGVLVMELVKDAHAEPAPRLGDLDYSPAEASRVYDQLLREVIRMLCAGVIHGDLSEFNVLMGHEGPVVIDFPQAIDPTHNPNAKKLLLRDVANLQRFLARFAPEADRKPHGEEIWALFQRNKLKPDTELTGRHQGPRGKVDTREVLSLIEDANRDEARRRGHHRDDEDSPEWASGEGADSAADESSPSSSPEPTPFRKVVDFTKERKPRSGTGGRSPARPGSRLRKPRGSRRKSASETDEAARTPPTGPAATRQDAGAKPTPARRRSRRRRSEKGSSESATPPSGPRKTKETTTGEPKKVRPAAKSGPSAGEPAKKRTSRNRRRRPRRSGPSE